MRNQRRGTLENNQRVRQMTLPDGHVVFQLNPAETSLQYRSIVGDRSYFRHDVRLEPGMTVFDVGANIGIAALAFHWECPGTRILAFEPARPLYDALCANLAAHGLNAKAFDCALSHTPGTATLTVYPETTAMSGMYTDVGHDAEVTRTFLANSGFAPEDVTDMAEGRHVTEEQECQVRTISEVMAAEGVHRIGLLKINVEKAECDVLAGIAPDDWDAVDQIVMQVHDIDGRLASVRDDLTGRGFQVDIGQDPLLRNTDIFDVYARRNST
ncbi:FkbM family methyltransferase [Streptosporangium sp. NPDC049644]|uniref:FkbM family methyltransferase n=1 Tax=Streptosporangium sp. NPDC049644 TaxID=3155507 RepID=UPI0034232B67